MSPDALFRRASQPNPLLLAHLTSTSVDTCVPVTLMVRAGVGRADRQGFGQMARSHDKVV